MSQRGFGRMGVVMATAGALGLGIAGFLAAAVPAGAVTITEFPVGSLKPGETRPTYIASSPAGRLAFVDTGTAYGVRQMDTTGALTGPAISAPAGATAPFGDLAFDLDGDLTWLANQPGAIPRPYVVTRAANGVVDPKGPWETFRDPYAVAYRNGVIWITGGAVDRKEGKPDGFHVCDVPDVGHHCFGNDVVDSRMTDLTLDSAGRMWAMQPEANIARRANASNTAFDLAVTLPGGSKPGRAALGPDGNLWIAAFGNTYDAQNTTNQIIRLTPSGVPTSFALPRGRGSNDIAAGPDGALWFTEHISGSIGRISTCGTYTSYPLPTAGAMPYGIVAGADGALWFTEYGAAKIGRLVPDPVPAGECGSSPPPGGGGTPPPPGGTNPAAVSADTTTPVLGSLGFSRTSFRAAKSGASTSGRRKPAPPVGTKVSFSLSEASSVNFTVEQPAAGRKVNGTCVKPKPSNRGKRRCTRWAPVRGSFGVPGTAGENAFTFRGRVGGKSLKPGGYRLTGQATDSAGNASSLRRRGFKIVP
jgi:hypothetical protein